MRKVVKDKAIEHMSLSSLAVIDPEDFTCWGIDGDYLEAMVLDLHDSGARKLLDAIEPYIQLNALPQPSCTCGEHSDEPWRIHADECQITIEQQRQGVYRRRIQRALSEIERVVPIWKSLPADDPYGKGFNVGRARAYEHIAEILRGIS